MGKAIVRLLVLSAAAFAVLAPTAASASDATGRDFGQHVKTCAQTIGFDATHNPGTHHGFSDWSHIHHC